jgi:hypothetical protein
MNFTRQQRHHMKWYSTRGGVFVTLHWDPWNIKSNHGWVLARPWRRPAGRPRWRSRWRRAFRREERARHDPQDLGSAQEEGVLDGQQWNRADDGRVRRPWRSSGVPSGGPVNTDQENTHEHQWITGKRSVYLEEPEIGWRELSTMESSSGGAGEWRIGVRAIPAEGSWELGWVGSRCWIRGWRSNWPRELGRGEVSMTNFGKGCTAAARC